MKRGRLCEEQNKKGGGRSSVGGVRTILFYFSYSKRISKHPHWFMHHSLKYAPSYHSVTDLYYNIWRNITESFRVVRCKMRFTQTTIKLAQNLHSLQFKLTTCASLTLHITSDNYGNLITLEVKNEERRTFRNNLWCLIFFICVSREERLSSL
jgi:hypothetical protein